MSMQFFVVQRTYLSQMNVGRPFPLHVPREHERVSRAAEGLTIEGTSTSTSIDIYEGIFGDDIRASHPNGGEIHDTTERN